jgi:two-component system, cell cycle sensor histidine kinase and response regulator CckA
MMAELQRILVVEDVPTDAELAMAELRRAGMAVEWRVVESEKELLTALETFRPDLVISDYRLPSFSGLDALRLVRERMPALPFILCTASTNEETAVECIKAGAWDYVLKDRLSRLPLAVRSAMELARTRVERERTEQALLASEERYRSLFEQSPTGIYRTAPDGRILAANPAILRMLGYSSFAELSTRNLEEQGFEPDYPRQRYKQALEERGEVRGFEAVWTTTDGRKVLVHENARAIRGELGEVLYYEGTAEDVTERTRAQRELGMQRSRLERASSAGGVALWEWEVGTDEVEWSSSVDGMLGYGPGELPRTLRAWVELVHPDDRNRVLEALRRQLEGGEPYDVDYRARRADGAFVWWHVVGHTERDPDGRPLRQLGASVDITTRRQAEVALAKREQDLRTILHTAQDGFWQVDDEGRLLEVNDAYCALSGYSREELLSMRVADLEAVETRAEVAAHVERIMTHGRDRFEARHRRKDGHLVDVEATVNLVALGERRLVAFIRDLSEQRRLTAQLLQAQKMEAVGNLAGGIAHDFNNLLQAILGQVLLLRECQGSAERLQAAAGRLEQLTMRGAGLTRQLLLFSRRETTRPETVEVNELVKAVADMVRHLVRENIRTELRLAGESLYLTADRGQLEQVLMNLLVNAADSMPTGGVLTLSTGRQGAEAWFAVADTGSGITEDVRGRLFEPFFTTKGPGKGTGLGLAVVHRIVTRHGGRVEVASEPGAGSTFTVLLPAAPQPARAQEPAARLSTAVPKSAGERVLLVEDDDAARDGLVSVLDRLGYETMAVASGEEALALPVEPAWQVLLTDLTLPGVSGADTAQALLRRWPALRVILMSGYGVDEAIRALSPASPLRFLQKPFDLPTLATEMRRALATEAL